MHCPRGDGRIRPTGWPKDNEPVTSAGPRPLPPGGPVRPRCPCSSSRPRCWPDSPSLPVPPPAAKASGAQCARPRTSPTARAGAPIAAKRIHTGIDLGGKRGTPIYAIEDGVIDRTKKQDNRPQIVMRGESGSSSTTATWTGPGAGRSSASTPATSSASWATRGHQGGPPALRVLAQWRRVRRRRSRAADPPHLPGLTRDVPARRGPNAPCPAATMR